MIPLGAKTRLRKPPEGRSTSLNGSFLSITDDKQFVGTVCTSECVLSGIQTTIQHAHTHRDTLNAQYCTYTLYTSLHYTYYTHLEHLSKAPLESSFAGHAVMNLILKDGIQSTVCRRRGTGRNSLDRKMAFGMPRGGKTSC